MSVQRHHPRLLAPGPTWLLW